MNVARTTRTFLVLALLVAATMVPSLVVAKESPSRGGSDRDDDADERNRSPESNQRGREYAGDRKPGRIMQADGALVGRFVSFERDPSACAIKNVSVYGVPFWAEIRLPGPCESNGGSLGSTFRLEGEEAELRFHDAPNALLEVRAEEGVTALFVPASNVTVAGSGGNVTLNASNLQGTLRAISGGQLAPSGPGWALADGKARFWVHPLSGTDPLRQAVRDGLKQQRVGAQVDVLVDDGNVVSEVLAFDDVIVKAKKADNSTFRFLIDGNLTQGRVFVFNFAPGAFRHDRVGVRYFDLDETQAAHEVAIREADNLSDLMNIAPGEGPKYRIVRDDAGRHVLVAVPEFSVHVVEIMDLDVQVAPVIVGGLLAGLGVVAVAAVDLLRPRRRAD